MWKTVPQVEPDLAVVGVPHKGREIVMSPGSNLAMRERQRQLHH
jgi:hypothetical protein